MKVQFDFILHWLWTIVFALLALTGIAMVGPKYGWTLGYDLASADYVHRVCAAIYVLLTFIVIVYEVFRAIRNDDKRLVWQVIGKGGYQIFTLISTLIFIITGLIIWFCMSSDMKYAAFALYIHEKLTYLVIASVIWHIFMKCHALVWPQKSKAKKRQSLTNE